MKTEYHLVIETDQYAGNFEREMCAYIFCVIGECGVGAKFAEEALEELPKDFLLWVEEHCTHKMDDHGCSRPVAIDRMNNESLVIVFDEHPGKWKEIIRQRAEDFYDCYKALGGILSKYQDKITIKAIKVLTIETKPTCTEEL